MRTKGKLCWKYEWYSICSQHQEYNKDCEICNHGSWHNVWKKNINKFFGNINIFKIT